MTMLPDVDETSYDDWQRQQAAQEMDQKIQSFGLEHAMNSRIAELSQFQAPTPSDSLTNPLGGGNTLPPPEPVPAPVQEPPTPAPEPQPEPSPAPPAPPPTPAAAPTSITPPGAAAGPPQPDLSGWYDQVWSQGIGAVARAGGDVQQFADDLWQRLNKGVSDGQDAFGQGLAAAQGAGANLQQFASSYDPAEPPAPQPAPVSAPAAGAALPQGGGLSLGNASDRVRGNSDIIARASATSGVPAPVIAAIMDTEAGGPNSLSPAGAKGFMQVMPQHFRPGEDPYDPETNIQRGADILADNYKRLGSWDKAAAAYFGAVDANGNILGGARDARGTTGAGYVGRFQGNLNNYQGGSSVVQDIQQTVQGAGNTVGGWLDLAKQQLNKPYIWGSGSGAGGRGTQDINAATGLPNGFDCSGYVSWVMKNGLGVDVPAQTSAAYGKLQTVNPSQARPGDIVFYNMDNPDPHMQHMALYIGDGQIIQAGGTQRDVNIASVNAVGTPEFRRAAGTDAADSRQLVGASLQGAGGIANQTPGGSALASAPPLGDTYWYSPPDTTPDTIAAHRPDTYMGGLQAASVGEPQALPQAAPEAPQTSQSPAERLKSAFGDFIDSVGSTARGASDALGSAAGGLLASPGGGLPAQAQPTPSDTLTNPVGSRYTDVQSLAAPSSPPMTLPDVLGAVGGALPDITGTLQAQAPAAGSPLDKAIQNGIGTLPPAEQAQALQEWNRGYVQTREQAIENVNPARDVLLVGGLINQLTDPEQLAILAAAGPFGEAAGGLAGGGVRGAIANQAVQGALGNAGYVAAQGGSPEEIAQAALTGGVLGGGVAGVGAVTPALAKAGLDAIQNPEVQAALRTRQRAEGINPLNPPPLNPPAAHGPNEYPRYAPRAVEGRAEPAAGMTVLNDALFDLGRYPEEIAGPVRDLVLSSEAPPSTVGSILRRWMEENPIADSPIAKSREAAAEAAPGVVRDLNAQIRGGGGAVGMPTGEMPGQMGLDIGDLTRAQPPLAEGAGTFSPEMLLPDYRPQTQLEAQRLAEIRGGIDMARAARIARGEPDVPTTGLTQAESDIGTATRTQPLMPEGEGTFRPEMLLPDYVPKSQLEAQRLAEIRSGIDSARAARAARGEADLPTAGLTEQDLTGFRAPQLKLPVYVNKEVRDLLEQGNQSVSHARPIDAAFLEDLSGKSGESTERLRKVWKASPENDAVLRSVNKALDDAGRDLVDAQQKLKLDPTSGEAAADLVRQVTRYQSLQETAGGRRPEAAGILSQLKTTREGKLTRAGQRAADEQLDDMARRAKAPDTDTYASDLSKVGLTDEWGRPDPEKVGSFARVVRNHTWGDYVTALYYFNLLSNPLTQVRNVVGNTAVALTTPLEQLGAAAWDPTARRLLGETGPRQRYFGEAGAQLAGYKDALQNDVLPAVTQSLRYGNVSKSGELGRLAHEPFAGTPGEFIGYPGRSLEAEDQAFGAINRAADIRAQAYRQAKQEGLDGEAFTNRVAQLTSAPSDDMLKAAESMSEYRTFKQTDRASAGINQLSKEWPGVKGIMPFVRVPINIAKYTLERSPAGFGKMLWDAKTPAGRAALQTAGSGELADRLSRATLGSLLMYGMFKYAESGNLTGRAPDDPVERAQWEREGKTPYSFKTPTGGWQSYEALQPFTALVGSAADIADAMNRNKLEGKDSDLGALGTVAAFAMARGLANTQFTDGLTQVLDLLQGQGTNVDVGQLATTFAGQQLSNVVAPGALRAIARMTDDIVRDPKDKGWEGVLQRAEMNLPGLQSNVPEAVGAFGETRHRVSNSLSAVVNPFPYSQETTDPVEIELKRLQGVQTPGLPKKLGNSTVEPGFVGKSVDVPVNNQVSLPTTLDDDQRRHYQQQSGALAYSLLSGIIGTPQWDALSDDEKAAKVDQFYSIARQAARTGMQGELLPQALGEFQDALRRRQATRGGAPAQLTEEPAAQAAGG